MQRNLFISFIILFVSISLLTGCKKQQEITLEEVKENTETAEEFTEETSLEEDSVKLKEKESSEQERKENNQTEAEAEKLCVYVCGSVQEPGVYTLSSGSRVFDGILAAGGVAEDAAGEYLNQAKPLEDGERIYVPSIEEVTQLEISKFTGMDSSGEQMRESGQSESDGKVHINSATLEELMTLTGIGKAKASAILSYREANGKFSSIDQLMQIEGIKEGTFEKIKNEIAL